MEVNIDRLAFEKSFDNVYSQNLTLTERSRMSAGISEGLGDSDTVSGDIVINMLRIVSLDDSSIGNTINENAEGNAGDITITTNSLEVTHGGRIRSDISGTGEGGNISINATESVIVDGERSNGFSSIISSNIFSDAQGKAGNLEITANSLEVTNGGFISTNSFTTGDAGNIFVDATKSVIVDGKNSDGVSSKISSDVGFQARGDGGNIEITTGSF